MLNGLEGRGTEVKDTGQEAVVVISEPGTEDLD